jgi:hypothetical protein
MGQRICFLLVLLALGATFAGASEKVEVEFFGVDFGHFEAYAWKPGAPAPNFQVERAIHQTVEERLAARGLRKVDRDADCHVITRAAKHRHFPVGVLFVELLEAGTDRLVWRGMATGTVTSEKIKKRQKVAVRVVKKMFKQFPDLGS